MLKLLGAVLVIGAAGVFGFVQAAHYARRPRQIRQFIQALQRMETEIIYALTPLPEALQSLAKQCAEPFASMFRQAAEQLGGQAGHSTRDIWRLAVEESWRRSSMKLPEREIALQLGNVLGLTDRSDQVKHLRLAVSQLQSEEEEARDEQRLYERMWKSLGVLIGALIVILMY